MWLFETPWSLKGEVCACTINKPCDYCTQHEDLCTRDKPSGRSDCPDSAVCRSGLCRSLQNASKLSKEVHSPDSRRDPAGAVSCPDVAPLQDPRLTHEHSVPLAGGWTWARTALGRRGQRSRWVAASTEGLHTQGTCEFQVLRLIGLGPGSDANDPP